MKTLLSLFDYTGNWALPFAESGEWNVLMCDIKHEHNDFDTFSDIMSIDAKMLYENIFENFGTIDGIIAAVPCTEFAVSGARWFKQKDRDGRTKVAIDLVYQTMQIIECCRPNFWCIENPISRIHTLVPDIGKPAMYFNPCDFGEPYTKKTALYGKFNANLQKNIVEPTEGSKMHRLYGGKSERTKALRSVTPPGFAKAFFEANNNYEFQYQETENIFY